MGVYLLWDGTRYNGMATRFHAGTMGWSAPAEFETDTGGINRVAATMDGLGNAYINAQENFDAGLVWDTWAYRAPASVGDPMWTGTWLETSSLTVSGLSGSIAANERGEVVAVWRQSFGGGEENFISRFGPSAGLWSDAGVVSSTVSTGTATIGINEEGAAFLLWTGDNGSRVYGTVCR